MSDYRRDIYVSSRTSTEAAYFIDPQKQFVRAASVIPRGFWTAYGEIAAAVTGTRRAARAVARTASRSSAFPNAWRVIHADGTIPDGWGGGGSGPRQCRELLEAEGVKFVDDRADPAKKLLADELELLLASEP